VIARVTIGGQLFPILVDILVRGRRRRIRPFVGDEGRLRRLVPIHVGLWDSMVVARSAIVKFIVVRAWTLL